VPVKDWHALTTSMLFVLNKFINMIQHEGDRMLTLM